MPTRKAFTLTELLVTIAIIIAIISIVLLFYPSREVRSADQAASLIETHLACAKARALRENRPVGVRLLSRDGNATFYALEIIETPASPFAPINPGGVSNNPLTIYLDLPSGNGIQAANQNANPGVVGNTARQVGVPLAGNVEPGDILQIVDVTESSHRIESIDYTTNTMTLSATKEQMPDGSWFVVGIPNVNATAAVRLGWNYRYLRKPRSLMGEQPIQLPHDVVIVGMKSLNIPTNANGIAEIFFSPSGQAINATNGRVVLWLADTNNVAKPHLVCIYPATGAIVSHPVGPAGNEFQYTEDGR